MKKPVIFLLSVILTLSCVNIYAQNPFCSLKQSSLVAGNTMTKEIQNERQKPYRSAHFESEGCSFRFRLQHPLGGSGWSSSEGIQLTVDGVDYGIVTLPWGGGSYAEIIKLLPSGEIQFVWLDEFDYVTRCFEIYDSSDSLIYKSDKTMPDDGLFLTYQNECCTALTDFEGAYIKEMNQVNLSWTVPTSVDLQGFDIFRNDELLNQVDFSTLSYSDNTAYLATGEYKYCVKPVYPFLCTFEEECFETYIELSIKNYSSALHLFPNPASQVVNIQGADIANVKVYNNIGQLILTQHNTNTINVSELQNGIYILSIKTLTGYIIHKKLIINR